MYHLPISKSPCWSMLPGTSAAMSTKVYSLQQVGVRGFERKGHGVSPTQERESFHWKGTHTGRARCSATCVLLFQSSLRSTSLSLQLANDKTRHVHLKKSNSSESQETQRP